MSMATDDERREVARRLREEADYPGHAVQYMEQFISDLRQVLFGDLNPTADYSEMFARLADLIDPSCDAAAAHTDATATRDVSQGRRSDVDREALLALADDLDYAGANVENVAYIDQTFHDAARRIREAMGVVR